MDNLLTAMLQLGYSALYDLLFDIYIVKPDLAVQLWLIANVDLGKMPHPMFYHGVRIGLFDNTITEYYLRLSHYSFYHNQRNIFPDDLALILKATMTYNMIHGYEVKLPGTTTYPLKGSQFERRVRMYDRPDDIMGEALATILVDDVAQLAELAKSPLFQFDDKVMVWAARFHAERCFRFLAINECPYTARTLDAACAGASEEIIQLCLEQSLVPSPRSLVKAINFHRNNVAEWLMRVHGVKFELAHFKAAFERGNWRMVADHLETVFVPYCAAHPDAKEQIMDARGSSSLKLHAVTHLFEFI